VQTAWPVWRILVLNHEDNSPSGFNPRYHVADKPLLPVPYEPVYIGSTLTARGHQCLHRMLKAAFRCWRHSSPRRAAFAIISSNRFYRGSRNTPGSHSLIGRLYCAGATATTWICSRFRLWLRVSKVSRRGIGSSRRFSGKAGAKVCWRCLAKLSDLLSIRNFR
jgi:hypothetical protein